jgi:hypothetical protein
MQHTLPVDALNQMLQTTPDPRLRRLHMRIWKRQPGDWHKTDSPRYTTSTPNTANTMEQTAPLRDHEPSYGAAVGDQTFQKMMMILM